MVDPFDQLKVPPGWLGLAVKTTESPEQIVSLLTVTDGFDIWLTVTNCVSTQPLAPVIKTE